MAKHHAHRLDVYDVNLMLATNAKQWRSVTQAADIDDDVPTGDAGKCYLTTDTSGDTTALVLWVNVNAHRTQAELVNTLAHEASHAAGQLLEHVGHEVAGVDEPSAYLVGWITGWLFTCIEGA